MLPFDAAYGLCYDRVSQNFVQMYNVYAKAPAERPGK